MSASLMVHQSPWHGGDLHSDGVCWDFRDWVEKIIQNSKVKRHWHAPWICYLSLFYTLTLSWKIGEDRKSSQLVHPRKYVILYLYPKYCWFNNSFNPLGEILVDRQLHLRHQGFKNKCLGTSSQTTNLEVHEQTPYQLIHSHSCITVSDICLNLDYKETLKT